MNNLSTLTAHKILNIIGPDVADNLRKIITENMYVVIIEKNIEIVKTSNIRQYLSNNIDVILSTYKNCNNPGDWAQYVDDIGASICIPDDCDEDHIPDWSIDEMIDKLNIHPDKDSIVKKLIDDISDREDLAYDISTVNSINYRKLNDIPVLNYLQDL